MIRYLLVLLLLIIPTKRAYCGEHPVFNHIIKNNPDINREYAMELSNIIVKLGRAYGINPIKLSAMLATESKYQLNAVNSKTNDYGISQINKKTMVFYNFSKHRLLTDLEYSVKAGVIVLADFKKRYAHKEPNWLCRYNVGTAPMKKIEKNCNMYLISLEKYL